METTRNRARGHAEGRVWCGVDIGTTNVKALIVDAGGVVRARISRPTPRRDDAFGPCTDVDDLFALIETIVIEAYREAAPSAPLAALCAGGVGEDGVPLDAALHPLDLAIPWNDRRAASQADRLAASALWRSAHLPVPVEPTRTAAKWAWLAEHRPEAMRQAATWIALTDYPALRWTGRPFMSRTLATRTACYDPVGRTWLPALLRDCGAPPLPPVLPGGTVLGAARSARLAAAGVVDGGTLVVAGGHDHPMGASLACGSVTGAILDSMGTAELVYVEGDGAGESGADAEAGTPFYASAAILDRRPAWLAVLELSGMLEPLLCDGNPLQKPFAALMAGGAAPGTPGAGGLRFGPGMRLDTFAPDARPPERLRAVLEYGAALTRDLIARADWLSGAEAPGPVFVAGGWARSDSLLQLRADVIGRTLRRIEEPQLSALGSAHLAARGTGTVLPATLPTQDFAPDPARRAFYDRAATASPGQASANSLSKPISPMRPARA